MSELTREEWLEKRNELELKVLANNRDIKTLNKRVAAVEDMSKELKDMNGSLREMLVKMDAHKESLDDIEEEQECQDRRLATLEQADGEKWQAVIKALIGALTGALITYLFTH